jgi:MYXO-CTERM domain-containing protein
LSAEPQNEEPILINRFVSLLRPLTSSPPRLAVAAFLLAVLAPRAAAAVQSAELYRTQAYFYGRFEARVRFAPGEGVVSSFFLWRDGSSSTTSWNELDYEKVNSTCKLQTNIWTGKGTQSAAINTPTFDICADYHTYAFEWTPDYIAWFIDGSQIRKVTGASVTEYTQNASQGMSMHFNIWQGDSSFGGTLNPSTLPVRQFISWAQYSSYANGTFTQQWREDFNGSTTPSGWALGNWSSPYNLSTHNPANVNFVNGIAVLSMTADGATGFTGTPPTDTSGGSGTGGTGGGGRGGTGGSGGGAAGRGGTGGTTGGGGRGGTGGSTSPGSGGTSSTGGGTGAGGVAGSGAGGVSAGAGGNGAGGVSAGAGGDGAGGVSGGTAGSGAGGSSGVAGATGSGGTAGQDPTGTGGVGTAGTSGPGQAGSTGQTGGDSGCACDVGAASGGSAMTGLLLLAATAGVRRRRSARPRRGTVKR